MSIRRWVVDAKNKKLLKNVDNAVTAYVDGGSESSAAQVQQYIKELQKHRKYVCMHKNLSDLFKLHALIKRSYCYSVNTASNIILY